MVVIYAEKSSLAKEIASALFAGKRIANPTDPRTGHYHFSYNFGNGQEEVYLVHGQGHLVTLAPAYAYNDKFKKWDTHIYPCIPDNFKLVKKKDTIDTFDYLKPYFDKADWLINATDPDREGELIFDYVYRQMNCNKSFKRVWLTDLTTEKIQYAFHHLINSEDVYNMQLAGRARGIADWLYGINFTVGFTKKFSNEIMTIGRVQTPTLALVVKREKEIKDFVKKPFYKLIGEFTTSSDNKYTGEFVDGNFDSIDKANIILNKIKYENKGYIIDKKVVSKKHNAPLLFNSTQLQIACSKKFNWDLKKTEATMQKLYEAKLMTYPRTNTEHLTVAMQDEITQTIKKIMSISEYSEYALPTEQWREYTKRHFDDTKVGSHTAITPTLNVPSSLSSIENEDMRMLYDLLCKSLMRIVYPQAVIEETKIITKVGDYNFKSSGNTVINNGWFTVDAIPEDKGILPQVNISDEVKISVDVKKGMTAPPKRYTEASLIDTMEMAGQHIEDEEIKTLMKLQKKGLGTDATRVATIEALYRRNYIAKKGKTIYPTDKGIYIIDTLPVDEIKSANLTGEMEKILNDIAEGRYDYNNFISVIKQNTKTWYQKIVGANAESYVNKSEICPLCSGKIYKGNKNYYCSNYKNGCKLSIPFEILGKKLTQNQITMLITSSRTNIIKGFTSSKTGKTFDASLKLNSEGKVEFVFDNKKSNKKKKSSAILERCKKYDPKSINMNSIFNDIIKGK